MRGNCLQMSIRPTELNLRKKRKKTRLFFIFRDLQNGLFTFSIAEKIDLFSE